MTFQSRWRNRAFTLVAAVVLCLSHAGLAQSQDVLGSNVNGLVAWDFSDHYITPRGLNVEDKGLIVQPLLLMLWKLHGSNQGAVSDVTLTTGIWNSFHSHASGAKPSRWMRSTRSSASPSSFARGSPLICRRRRSTRRPIAYETSTHAAFKLTYNDSFRKGLAVNPYVAYWRELNHKSTVMFNRATSKESGYLTLGATPTFGLGAGGVFAGGRRIHEHRGLELLPAIRWLRWRIRPGGRLRLAEGQRAAEIPGRQPRRVEGVLRRQLLPPQQRGAARWQPGARESRARVEPDPVPRRSLGVLKCSWSPHGQAALSRASGRHADGGAVIVLEELSSVRKRPTITSTPTTARQQQRYHDPYAHRL